MKIDVTKYQNIYFKCSDRSQQIWVCRELEKIANIEMDYFYETWEGDIHYPYFYFTVDRVDFSSHEHGIQTIKFEDSVFYSFYSFYNEDFGSFLDYKLKYSKNKIFLLDKLKETNPKLLEREGLI